MKPIRILGLALGASIAMSAGMSTAAFAQDISVAVAGPMTGSESAFGRQMKNGADLAVADLNAAGGVNGKITLSGTGAELLARPEIRAAYLEGGRH